VAVSAARPISVDGRLDEPDWLSAAPLTDFRQVEPEQGAPARFRTVVRVVYDATHLYIGAFCHDSLGARGVRVQDLRRKFDYYENDLFGLSLDALHDGRNSVAFQVTPYGTQRELQSYDGDTFNEEWEAVWRVRTEITDSGWTAELAIPWSTLRYHNDGQPWNVNFYRRARRTNELSAWRPWPRNLNPYRMDFSARLEGLAPPPPRTNLRFRPYALLRGDRIGRGAAKSDSLSPSVGGELTWAPNPSTVVDLTVRTDFAQAEVDRQVINLTRFSVFFPEKRQFFLENANLFTVGLEGSEFNLQPFFSRRVGLSEDGVPIPIQAGARLVRRDARSGLGALAIRQDGFGGAGPSTFGVARYSRNVGASGRLGALVSARLDEAGELAPARQGGTVGADWFTRFGSATVFNGMLSASVSSEPGGEGLGGFAFLGYTGNGVYAGLIEAVATREYTPATGFVSRPDVILTSPAVIGDWRPRWKPSFIRRFRPAVLAYLFNSATDFGLQEGYVQTYVDFAFESGALIYPYLQRDFQRPSAPFDLLEGVTIPAANLDAWRYGVFAKSDESAALSGRIDASWGGFFGGRADRYNATVRFAPSPRVALAVNYQLNRLQAVGSPAVDVTTHLLAPELRVALNARAQLSAFYQYNTSIDQGALNARLSWEFAPLSYLYLVYNDRRAVGLGDDAAPPDTPARQLVLKAVYLYQL
jgi:hypothetical protein